MNLGIMIDQRIVGDNLSYPSVARPGPACTMRRNMRVVHTRVMFDTWPMRYTQKAQEVQPEENRAKQQPVRNGFLRSHSQL
jgi:hypothetical protein